MKKILLIGDSISAGYRDFVALAFKDTAKVYFPKENCRFATYVLRNLWDWKNELGCGDDVDVIHWNAGLWDGLVMPDGKPLISFERYCEDIERICSRSGIEPISPTRQIFASFAVAQFAKSYFATPRSDQIR